MDLESSALDAMSSSILADGLGGILIAVWAETGMACLLVAILSELIAIPIVWRRVSWSIVGLIILANLVSAALAGIPAASRSTFTMPDVLSDPWYIHTHFWWRLLPWIAGVFAATCVVEFLCFLPLRASKRKRIGIGRFSAGVIVGNVVSYLILTGIIWYVPPRDTGDFELLPDTSWLAPADRRAWFVGPDTGRLYSIRLDGSDKRVETDRELARWHWFIDDISIYAIVPDRNVLLYIDADQNWRRREDGHEQTLSPASSDRECMRDEVFQQLLALLPDTVVSETEDGKMMEGVYFFAGVHYWRAEARSDDLQVNTQWHWGVGPDRWGVKTTTAAGETLRFGIKEGLTQMFCREPRILKEQGLILFHCGGWIMVMDPAQRKVGRLARGRNVVAQTPWFGSDSWR